MTQPLDDNLERELAALTQWQGRATTRWWQALKIARPSKPHAESLWQRVFSQKLSSVAMGSIALGCIFLVAVIMNLPSLSSPRRAAKLAGDRVLVDPTEKLDLSASDLKIISGSPYFDANESSSSVDLWSVLRTGNTTPKQFIVPSTTEKVQAVRQVVRRATIELKSDDVRAAFLKAQHLIRPADSEYVQNSALTGSGKHEQANLTLRVKADRLSDVLNELRELGEVESERHDGQDVTSQVVDLEARLQNETRVEKEILELLETRKDAPLKDILDMREKLREVRNEIERLTAHRQQLGKLVALATVLVIIRADDAPEPEITSLGNYFGESVAEAWSGSLLFLVDTLATMLRIIVGGLFFWVILAVIVWGVRRYRKNAA